MTIKDFHADMTHNTLQEFDDLDPDLIANYLRRHPDFFIDYENLLSDLALPHHTGEHAISLVERQVSVLRARNRDVRGRLNRLLDTARDNDRLFQKTQKLVLGILDQTSIDGIVDTVEASLRDDYQVDACSLLLIDQPHRVTATARTVSMEQASSNIGALLNSRQATCGHLRPEEINFLFINASKPIRSAAVMPLSQQGQPLGALAIGSFDPDYYRSSMGTLFLTYVADVLNRSIPRCVPSH
jgi:uncharacterized protein YigA (DUF484 family)